jgi:hypothetical protein
MAEIPEDPMPFDGFDPAEFYQGTTAPAPPHVVNWNTLSAEEAEDEWLSLNRWVDWLRTTFALPAAIIPPLWHRHPELVWELSALHTHWLGAYHPEQHGSAPIGWLADFGQTRDRLREWVATSGTRLDHDRPTRQTVWPGETAEPDPGASPITDREADFVEWVHQDVRRRQAAGPDDLG